ncbi:hypothetical protein FRB99_002409 [Tulasnella sp. 403]|nr:hypothetical protein FRB99_002409 [Tulasnella sp. 403]
MPILTIYTRDNPLIRSKLKSLKKVHCERLAHAALHKKITKEKFLSRSVEIVDLVEHELPADRRERKVPPNKRDLDAEAVVLNTKIMTNELESIVDQLRVLIDPNDTMAYDSTAQEDEEWLGIEKATTSTHRSHPIYPEPSDDEQSSSSERIQTIDEDEFFDDGWESGSVDENGRVVGRNHRHSDSSVIDSESDDNRIDMDLGVSDSEEGIEDDNAASNPHHNPHKIDQNIFLPSLSMGYLPGEYDPHDDYENVDIDGSHSGPRKNRRGQRARRNIAAREHGKNAKHVQARIEKKRVEKEREKERRKQERKTKPWRAQLAIPVQSVKQDDFFEGGVAPPDANVASKSVPKRLKRDQGWSTRRSFLQPNEADKEKKSVISKPLHPSWEAKLKAKAKESLAVQPPQGKKIVFS